MTDYSQGISGGELAFWNFAFTVPDKSADALLLTGAGYCQFQSNEDPTKIGYSDAVEWDYFWIDDPPTYWSFSSALLAALAGQFGTMQLITDEGFGAAGFGFSESPVSGGPVVGPTPTPPTTTTTSGGQRPPVTTTTSTTLPPTTTTTRRGAR